MKRFRLQTGETVIVDEEDAYRLREKVFIGVRTPGGGIIVRQTRQGGLLAHKIFGAPCEPIGDALDFRKSNLKRA